MNRTIRVNISVPRDLKARMEAEDLKARTEAETEKVNWSSVACRAIEARLKQLERWQRETRTRSTKDDVVRPTVKRGEWMSVVNLWEKLTHYGTCRNKPPYHEEVAAYQQALGQSACMGGQEIDLEPHERGWIVRIHACYESGEVKILIPRVVTEPVEVLKDTRTESEAYQTW